TFMFQRKSMVGGSAGCALVVLILSVSVARATHSWGGYHWARQSPQFTLKLGNNLSAGWQTHLSNASSDWNSPQLFGVASTALLTAIVSGQSHRKRVVLVTSERDG